MEAKKASEVKNFGRVTYRLERSAIFIEKRPEVAPAAAPRGRPRTTTNGDTWGQFRYKPGRMEKASYPTADAPPLNTSLAQLVAPRIATDALLAASCKVFDDR